MAEGQHASTPRESSGLSADAWRILEALREQAEPMDAISLSSVTRLQMETVLAAIQELKQAGAVELVAPEPVHERIAAPA